MLLANSGQVIAPGRFRAAGEFGKRGPPVKFTLG